MADDRTRGQPLTTITSSRVVEWVLGRRPTRRIGSRASWKTAESNPTAVGDAAAALRNTIWGALIGSLLGLGASARGGWLGAHQLLGRDRDTYVRDCGNTHTLGTIIRPNAEVLGPEGPVGRVQYVVVDESTREISDLVVHRSDGSGWLVPAREIALFRAGPGTAAHRLEPLGAGR
jgi:hypothetical protein